MKGRGHKLYRYRYDEYGRLTEKTAHRSLAEVLQQDTSAGADGDAGQAGA
ncbi:hypothetical protein FI178_20255 [Salmonella enterica subsp. enterica]|nr:hypothetical protein [Salmonella enterica subsp. enterica]